MSPSPKRPAPGERGLFGAGENTFGSHNLFHRDSYKYLPVYAEDALAVFHTGNLMEPIPPADGERETFGSWDGPGRMASGPAVRGRGSTNDNDPAPVQPPTPVPYRTVTWGEAYTGTSSGAPGTGFGVTQLQLCEAKGYEVPLSDYAAVVKATKAGHQLVARTELRDAGTGLRAVLECASPALPRPPLSQPCCAPRQNH